jgi:tetratricopeptide (TPR) repeat protein
MAKPQTRKRAKDQKRTSRPGGKKSPAAKKTKATGKAAVRASSQRRKREAGSGTGKARSGRARKPAVSPAIPSETRKSVPIMRSTPAPEKPPRLLGDTRSTAAALSLLEKAIKLIFSKDFKRARTEIKALLETHPGEKEILARARAYMQICNREEAALHKPAVAGDQLYTFAVMEHNRGNFDSAISVFNQLLAKQPDADYLYYALAASYALKGEVGQALAHLRRAIGLNESNRVYAKNDPDFNSLHEHGEFADLIGVVLQVKSEAEQS